MPNIKESGNFDYILTMGSFVQVTSCDLHVDNKLFERWNYDIMISLNLLFRTLLWFFLYQDMEGNIDWLDSTAAVISPSSHIVCKFSNSFLTVFRWFGISLFLSQGKDDCPNLFFVRRCLCRSNCYSSNWVLHVVLPLTSYDLYSQILSVYERSIKVFLFFFFWLFLLQKAEICWRIRKVTISCLLWSDRWKLHGEIQRHAIVITYMFMTNDRCEDSFV